MAETTDIIEFKDQQEAYAILGDRDAFLQIMQEDFSCRMVSRGNSIAVTGAEADVAAVRTLIGELLFCHRQGMRLTTHEVHYGGRMVRAGRTEELHGLHSEVLLVTAKGREVRAKTVGQRDYLAAIRRNAVTLGVGPAGTGKTYLAVVMAVAALRNREVSRIILTRLGFGSRMVVTGDLEQVDLPRGTVSGLRQACQILRGVKGVSVIRLEPVDIIRHEVVTRIVEAYGAWEKRREKHDGDHDRTRAGKS